MASLTFAIFLAGLRVVCLHEYLTALLNMAESVQTILIVDDNPDLLELLKMSFVEAGFSVITAASGPEALRHAKSLPDLIVLDLVLPEIDGFAVCQTLKHDRATGSIPIIMITGLTNQLNRLSGFECGASDYITKPFRPDDLVERTRILLNRPGSNPKP
jgi:DNA-binding response OmpR family regulator